MKGREEMEKWGTLEELLLGSAVNRHGTNNWDSVAMELQARKLSPFPFSSQECKVKYHVLQGRFNNTCSNGNGNGNGMPWVEELRKLRVAHLKRELQRYDHSIISLESKVRRLKAEREHREGDPCLGKSDLLQRNEDPPQPGVESSLPASSPLDSCYESSETTNKGHPHRTKQDLTESQRFVRASGDGLQEGSAESREIGEEEGGKGISENGEKRKEGPLPRPCDSSDVLSSAEYSSRKRRNGNGDGSSHEDEEEDVQGREKDFEWNQQQRQEKCSGESQGGETDEMSSISQRSRREAKVPGKLLPLLECLRTISANKFGPIFKHRPQSQGELYRSMIRRHMDLGMVRSKLEEGCYSGSLEFFRDVLLVFNNALVYYPKSSQEFVAAYVLREVASKEMENIFQTEALLKQEGPSTRKREPRKPILVCKKRSASTESHAKSTQTSSTSSLAAIQMQQSETVKPAEMKDPEVHEIEAAKGKGEEASKIPAYPPLNNILDSKYLGKARPDAITGNAREQSKSQYLAGELKNGERGIKKNTKKALKSEFREGGSSGIHDLGEFVASNNICESSIRENKSGSVKIEPSRTCSPLLETKNIRQEKKEDEELNTGVKQTVSIQLHSSVKRGVGRPPKHAHQKQGQEQQEAEETQLLVRKPRKKGRR